MNEPRCEDRCECGCEVSHAVCVCVKCGASYPKSEVSPSEPEVGLTEWDFDMPKDNRFHDPFAEAVAPEPCEHECGLEDSHSICVCALCGAKYPNPEGKLVAPAYHPGEAPERMPTELLKEYRRSHDWCAGEERCNLCVEFDNLAYAAAKDHARR